MSSCKSAPIVALLTDFGLDDWYVGTMKGVIKNICPTAELVDISHSVTPQSVLEGSLMLSAAHPYFPPDTVFLCVVDPGVGSTREAIIVRAADQWFVAPNNGLLAFLIRRSEDLECRRITNQSLFLVKMSSTFHGRDVFAPCAAHLAGGMPWTEIAAEPAEMFGLPTSAASFDEGVIEGNIVYFDRFGNAITNIARALFTRSFPDPKDVELILDGEKVISSISTTYTDAQAGHVLAYWGSSDALEIAVNRGNAHVQMELKLWDKVTLRKRMDNTQA